MVLKKNCPLLKTKVICFKVDISSKGLNCLLLPFYDEMSDTRMLKNWILKKKKKKAKNFIIETF